MALTRVQLVDPNCAVTDSDYEVIESAIMESSRGRWFLSEYARRNRHADTNEILAVLNNIKQTLGGNKKPPPPYLINTKFTLAYPANQKEQPTIPHRAAQVALNAAERLPTPPQPLQASPNVANARCNDKLNDSDLRRLENSRVEKDEFNFNY